MAEQQLSWKFWTIPNILTIIRILLVGPIIYCVLQESRTYFSLGIAMIIFAIATDFFDGKLARKYNMASEYGKILDPLADKIAVTALLLVLIHYRNFPEWAAAIIIGRDFLILLAGLIWTTKHRYVISSTLLGKWTAFFIAIMIVAYLVRANLIAQILTWNAVFFVIVSGITYAVRFIKTLKSEATPEKSNQ
jgi:cardiolipin synthase (CMP-forming)